MGKFCWEENEVDIADSQCALCKFDNDGKCDKYDIKPDKVLLNEILCKYFRSKGEIEL